MNDMKEILKKILPEWLILALYKVYLSFQKVLLFFSGIYFTYFMKTYKQNGLNIHIPLELTNFIFRGRFALNRYEVQEAKYISKYLPSNSKVLELGSCIGYISCLINQVLINKENHVTLEANPNLIKWIKKNRDINNCSFHIENSIISAESENIFYIHDLIVGGSNKRKTPNKRKIDGVSIDFLEKKYDIEFDTLIMDIEGGELDLLRDNKQKISMFKRVFFEVHSFNGTLTKEEGFECESILTDLGFNLIVRDGNFQIWETV